MARVLNKNGNCTEVNDKSILRGKFFHKKRRKTLETLTPTDGKNAWGKMSRPYSKVLSHFAAAEETAVFVWFWISEDLAKQLWKWCTGRGLLYNLYSMLTVCKSKCYYSILQNGTHLYQINAGIQISRWTEQRQSKLQ
jgi:hypothetical protein